MSPTPLGRPLLLASLLGLTLAAAPCLAQQAAQPANRTRLTPEQQQKLFPDWRQLNLQRTRGRIAILQKHQQCVAAASSLEALRTCQLQKRKALKTLHQQQRAAMRQLLQRNGITPPPRQDGGVPMI